MVSGMFKVWVRVRLGLGIGLGLRLGVWARVWPIR